MTFIEEMKQKVLSGGMITKDEAIRLSGEELTPLANAADDVRKKMCGDDFDICTIINGKCGRCSEDCKYCAQSAYNPTKLIDTYPLVDTYKMVAEAKKNKEQGVLRFSIVTSGRRLSDEEVDKVCESIKEIREKVGIEVCVSFGLLEEKHFVKLKEAGATRVHCNLESSEKYFSSICTTHTYEEKIETIKAAKRAGMSVCSGGILGLGESGEDRIDMVMTARELGVKSIPVNLLNPIPGTIYENNSHISIEEARRWIAVFRFIIPDASIRLAGGRGLLDDKGESCFASGANATISGDMLTTSGINVETDMKLLKKLGYTPRLCN